MSAETDKDVSLERIDWSAWPTPPDDLRRDVLARTSVLVRRRASWRRLRLATGWGLAYAAGLLTAWLGLRQPTEALPEARPTSVRQTATHDVVKPLTGDLDSLSPQELRRRVAGAPRAEQIRLLRMAGDRYLFGAADVEGALDCYRQVIELTPRRELAGRDSADSWLLAELKSSAAGVDARLAAE